MIIYFALEDSNLVISNCGCSIYCNTLLNIIKSGFLYLIALSTELKNNNSSLEKKSVPHFTKLSCSTINQLILFLKFNIDRFWKYNEPKLPPKSKIVI